MKKVKYKGSLDAVIYSLNLDVKPGDVIQVPDDFYNPEFEEIVEEPENNVPDSNKKQKGANK